nr:hypothetical protein [Tanacetum cinerariifolium]
FVPFIAIWVLDYAGVSGRGLVRVVGEKEKWQEEWGVVLQVVAGNHGEQCIFKREEETG